MPMWAAQLPIKRQQGIDGAAAAHPLLPPAGGRPPSDSAAIGGEYDIRYMSGNNCKFN